MKVIPDIPDYPLCHLEGRNGIGKSVAARLLELATGAQPYAGLPNAWRTLRDQLGPTTITVTGLPEDQVLEFDVDPDSWPEDPVRELGERFARISLNGMPATPQVARGLLRVRRISGDETLVQTLARDVDERAVIASSLERLRVRPAASDWEVRLEGLAELTGGVNREKLASAWSARQEADAAVAAAEQEATRAVVLAEAATGAAAAMDRLAVRRRDLPPLLVELADAGGALAGARQSLEETVARVERAAVALAQTGSLRGDIERWERLLGYRQRAVQRESIKERQLLSALSLSERPEPKALSRMSRDVSEELRQAFARRDSVDLVQPLRHLANQIETPLAAESHRLGGEVIANLKPPASVDALLTGIRDRRAELAGRPRPDELVRLDQEIVAQQRRQTLLRALSAQVDVTDRKKTRLREANEQLHELLSDLTASDRAAYEGAQAAMETARDEVVAAELRTREARKKIAQLLEIPYAQPDVTTGLTAEDDEDEQDEAADQQPPADSLYPDLDEELATRTAAVADQETASALVALDESALSVLAEAGAPVSVSTLRAVTTAGPLVPLAQDAIDAMRSLHAAAASATAAATLRRDAVDHARAVAKEALERLSGLRQASRRAVSALTAEGPNDWAEWREAVAPIFAANGVLAPGGEVPAAQSETDGDRPPDAAEFAVADALESIAAIARAQAAAALDLADRLAALSGFLSATANQISPRHREIGAPQASDYQRRVGPALPEWLEQELASLLSAPELLAALFDQADQVRVGLADLTLTWHPAGGGVRKRPLEAFSSGEQVFAYTRANLARLGREREPGQHLVVFLDEFGAFVARDRLGQLLDFVEHEALGPVADQVVVMLPLSRDYPAPRDGEDPHAGDWQDERGRQLAERGYFAVPFTSGRAHLA
ncbi:hypothetical protein GCU60_05680 [Blastococcus saxobsidens]|uniref:Uncharacterized protein n=1 Tax=Blastococcus saxobsidens TaxID=138336 RepID=A0A6L9W1B0_9ACTN|nr:hypothetical protein [Blastococcus saxobsidens]NEK85254.1 hypothetical protein [Blastococcus saxobsidens]